MTYKLGLYVNHMLVLLPSTPDIFQTKAVSVLHPSVAILLSVCYGYTKRTQWWSPQRKDRAAAVHSTTNHHQAGLSS